MSNGMRLKCILILNAEFNLSAISYAWRTNISKSRNKPNHLKTLSILTENATKYYMFKKRT